MIELCAKMPQLDGVGCAVAKWKGNKELDYTNDLKELWIVLDAICSKCPVTKALNIAKELWPCEGCDSGKITHTAQDEQYTCDCPECHGLGISKEAFWGNRNCSHCRGRTFIVVKVKNPTLGKYEDYEDTICPHCQGTGRIHREPWAVVGKLGEYFKGHPDVLDAEFEEYYRGQFFQIFWLWDRLRDLTGEAGSGREK